MINFTIKNMPKQLHQKLQERAEKNHRSLNREIIFELQQAVQQPRLDAQQLLEDARKMRASVSLKIKKSDLKRFKALGRA